MREYELEVLEQYDIEVKGTRKIRGAFFCDTKEGTMLLKDGRFRQACPFALCRSEQPGKGGISQCGYPGL